MIFSSGISLLNTQLPRKEAHLASAGQRATYPWMEQDIWLTCPPGLRAVAERQFPQKKRQSPQVFPNERTWKLGRQKPQMPPMELVPKRPSPGPCTREQLQEFGAAVSGAFTSPPARQQFQTVNDGETVHREILSHK